ncbi:hypothetical protein IFR04_003144 [Cadophora malorum]|uniref:Uncharacterized protein n=1 Tax=Cadophora malorum TaxID=108018 RepID=A0A8H7WF43_9HELO|nr:hypothetical protein IFR04_003144 [Cadophora malorum]
MEEQTRAKQICDDDRKRFKRLHDEEWERERIKRLCSRLPPKITHKNEEILARELEEQEEQRAEAAWIVDDRMLADPRAHQEQERVRDEQLLERRRAQEEQRAKEQRAEVARIVEDRMLANQRAHQERERVRDEQLLERHRARKEQRARNAQITCLRESFIDVKLGRRISSKRRGRDSHYLVDFLLESSFIT